MIETEIKVRYDSLVKAQEEVDRLTSELRRMMEAGGSSVEEMQRLQDELTEVRKSISDNADELTRWADVSAGDLSEAIEKAEFAVNQLNDTVKANKEIIAGLEEEYGNAKSGLEELAAQQLEFNEALFSDKNEIADLEEYIKTLDEGSIAYRSTSERLAELRAEVQTLQPVLEKIDGEIKSKTDRMAETQKALEREKANLAENTKAQTQMQMTLDRTKKEYENMTARITANNEKLKASTQSFQNVATKMFSAAGLGGGLVGLFYQARAVRAEMQNMESAMETMMGKDMSKGIMADLTQLAKQTPLAMTDMVGAEKLMVSFGLDAKESVKYIKALSDISGGESGKFNSLSLAFSQMSAAGKLMGQDLIELCRAA